MQSVTHFHSRPDVLVSGFVLAATPQCHAVSICWQCPGISLRLQMDETRATTTTTAQTSIVKQQSNNTTQQTCVTA